MSQFSSPEANAVRAGVVHGRGFGTVVVTGASSGIGEATAFHLASLGYRVLAGVRKQEDFERLRGAAPGLEPVILDITDAEHIAALAELVDRTEPAGLTALVNNAGVGALGPMEALDIKFWRLTMETNVVGTVALTQALIPSLLRRGGRVINMGSGGGRVAFPLFGPYVASKFALEGLTDVLRREIEPHGVRVILMEPGVIATPAFEKGLPETLERRAGLAPEAARRYGRLLDSALRAAAEAPHTARPPIEVAEAVAKALGARRPRPRYVVGWDSRTATICARVLPDRMIDFVIRRLTAS